MVFTYETDLAAKNCQTIRAITNAKNCKIKIHFFLVLEQILNFSASTNLIREMKNVSPSFKSYDEVLRY